MYFSFSVIFSFLAIFQVLQCAFLILALMELCDLIRKEKAHPCGIIAAPVGFVHVCESKHMVKPFSHIPKLIVEGRKGGSNLAATLVNAILTFDDAEQLKPGRDV